MKRKTIAAILGSLGLASTLIIPPTMSANAQDGSGTCTLFANQPFPSAGGIEGTGGRRGCTDTVTLGIRIRRHRRFLPDQTLSAFSTSLVNGNVLTSVFCGPFATRQPITVFTETFVVGTNQKVQSPRGPILC